MNGRRLINMMMNRSTAQRDCVEKKEQLTGRGGDLRVLVNTYVRRPLSVYFRSDGIDVHTSPINASNFR